MEQDSWATTDPGPQSAARNTPFELGRRLRHLRKQQGLTLAQAGTIAGVAASHLSLIENGKREARIGTLQRLAAHFGVTLDELTGAEPPNRRAALEIELERMSRSPLATAKNLPKVRIGPRLPMDALEALVAMHRQLERDAEERIATPEEARRANAQLRQDMRRRDNYFRAIEESAAELLQKVGYRRGPLSEHLVNAITQHLGFSLHHVADLPQSTRSVTDLRNRRIYLSRRARHGHDPRYVLLQALGHHVLGHDTPSSYGDFLRQRVETNYFAAALLMPESSCVDLLRDAHKARQLAVEDIRDIFAVSYESAAHRVTNLVTHHLQIPVHFMRVHEGGIIYKAYENDDVAFPTDHTGAIEGQRCCRYWTSRMIFTVPDTFNAYNAYTDTSTGTYWCTARTEHSDQGTFSTCLGVPYVHAKWFRGRETTERSTSRCPDPSCCQAAPDDLRRDWEGQFLPSSSAHTHLLATLPPGAFPGIDEAEVYGFLSRHAGSD
ncbi:helix-turn-helix domain-containing protein [Naumannella halotolerans]|uniref:helix-turn-helix domain-containing protein n=1 Tax=Naumannella halotolerans TaxID=993414 RepID=UPI00370DC611